MTLTVLRAGMLTTVQDTGRPGHAHLGVPLSGALDAASHALANRLLGNAPGAAALETTLTGCTLRAGRELNAVVGGAPCPVRLDGRPAPWGAPVRVPRDAVLDVGPAVAGVRSYVAVDGGIDVPPVLGSRSTDLLAGIGPAPLRDGDVLPLGTPVAAPPAAVDAPWPGPPTAVLVLPVRLGPRTDWFTDTALRTLTTAEYTVTAHSNRVGLRLDGPPLGRARYDELPSEGMVLGAIQVPPDGHPVVFLNDHPTTGGYPVPAVVDAPALSAAAQAGPGTRVRFTLGAG